MNNAQNHTEFEFSLIRGTRTQAKANANKAQYLKTFLEIYAVDSMEELTSEELVTLNVNIIKVDAEETVNVDYSEAIGAMIATDRENGNYKGRD